MMIRKWFSNLTDKYIKRQSIYFFVISFLLYGAVLVWGGLTEEPPVGWRYWLELSCFVPIIALLEGGTVYGALKLGRRWALGKATAPIDQKED